MPVSSGSVNDEVIIRLVWDDSMDLEDKFGKEPADTTSMEQSGGGKAHLST